MKKIAFIFPGQGSQDVGMLSELECEFPEVKDVFSKASKVLDYDLWELVKHGPIEKLNTTEYTQPALLAASFAIWNILSNKTKLKPDYLAGHSLGEYTALVCAEAISFTDAIELVAARGKYMQEAVPLGVGALAAIIGLEDAEVIKICDIGKLDNEILQAANFNSKGQVVIAGSINSVKNAIKIAKDSGARLAKLLPVSVPSHCDLMQPAALKLKSKLQNITINKPKMPVINNVDVKPYSDSSSIEDGLVRQLFSPVRFVEIIEYFSKNQVDQIVECGPGKVLSGLIKRIDSGVKVYNTFNLDNINKLIDYAESE